MRPGSRQQSTPRHFAMVLSAKQQLALANANPGVGKQLVRAFREQNAGKVPGRTRDEKQRTRANNTHILRSQPGSNFRGERPNGYNWEQTPASSNVVAPRGFGYYDAFAYNPYSVVTHMSIGPATPIVGTTVCQEGLETRKPFSLTSGGEAGALLFIFIPGPSHQTAVMYQCSSSFPVDPVTYQSYESPALKNDAPHDAIVTRASLRIRNWTQSVGRGGQVRVLRMTTGTALSGDMTNADLVEFQENMRVHTRTRTYGGDELAEAMQKNATVVDQSKAITFKPWDIAEAIPGYPFGGTGIPQSSKAQTLWEPAYTPIAILFEPFVAAVNGTTVGNKYEIDLRTQYLAHYKQGTMLANMAINPPIDGQAIEKHRAVEESSGSMLQKVGAAIQHAGQ